MKTNNSFVPFFILRLSQCISLSFDTKSQSFSYSYSYLFFYYVLCTFVCLSMLLWIIQPFYLFIIHLRGYQITFEIKKATFFLHRIKNIKRTFNKRNIEREEILHL